MQKNNKLKNTKCQRKEAQFIHLAFQGGPCPPSVKPLVMGLCWVLVVIEAFSFHETVA